MIVDEYATEKMVDLTVNRGDLVIFSDLCNGGGGSGF
jgi:hypothetical protein